MSLCMGLQELYNILALKEKLPPKNQQPTNPTKITDTCPESVLKTEYMGTLNQEKECGVKGPSDRCCISPQPVVYIYIMVLCIQPWGIMYE